MRVQKVEIKNFKSISSVSTELNGNNVFLVAPNGQGKTTFIDACFGNMPKQPLKSGEKKGSVSVDLGEYIVEHKFTAINQKPKLTIFDKSGRPQKTPAKLFKELFGITDFDIDAFLSQTPKKQVEIIKQMIGIDWSDVDERFKELYQERTFKTRQAKEIDGEVADRPFAIMGEPISVDDIQKQLIQAIDDNAKIERIKAGLVERQQRLDELAKEHKEVIDAVKAGQKWLEGKTIVDVSELQETIASAAEHNASHAANEQVGKLRAKAGEMWDQVETIQTEMDEIEATKKSELENSVMPIKGLEFDDDQLFLDGLPFNSDQINTARRITAGLELQFQMMNDVKIARLDGSLLDKKSMKAVEEWAEERNIQLFVELVDRDGDELKIEVHEESEPEPAAEMAAKPEPGTIGAKFTHESEGLTVSGRGTIRKTYQIIGLYPALQSAVCKILDDNTVMSLSENAVTNIHLNDCKDKF